MEPEDYDRLLADLRPRPTSEVVGLEAALGRRTAHEVRAPQSVPRVPTSAMDGFALDAAALAAARSGGEVSVVGDIAAGRPYVVLEQGTAVRVMTGAHVPSGAEAVVPVEFTDAQPAGGVPSTIRIADLPADLPSGWNIRRVGEDVGAGTVVLAPGDLITDAGTGLLAMLGIAAVDVTRPLHVGLIVTGDELGAPDAVVADASAQSPAALILNSNLPMLEAAIASAGASAHTRVCGDDPEAFLQVLEELSADTDLVITTGGISQGAYEVVRSALEGAHSTFGRVAMRPGGPQGHGRYRGTPLLHFPGTPAAAHVSFHLFARTLLGAGPLANRWRKAVAAGDDLSGHPRGVSLRPGVFTPNGEVEAMPRSRLHDFARADAIIRVPRAPAAFRPGDVVDILPC
ncbi:molybdopterin molybdotransferase [Brevibacterium sanguinis]|uniref:Molybdopterin molybdenumtransferase n=2 Tax=Brevibacterium TaxID=1696 RepID=A0A366II29_9MICO|nr:MULTISPECIES: molybdopterin molybdotransferase MoeA [Brevibacterium]RBP64196.1 molybdopterin molybdotransferase [Brevibacterium sanguinis]RBP71512.1 molybdopterin molybdotransferase [Brevibacterium celere]